MAEHAEELQVLTQCRSQIAAAEIVNILQSHGIEAAAVGGFASEFQAGAPGSVDVLVHRRDLDEAVDLLTEFQMTPVVDPEGEELDRGSRFARTPAEPVDEQDGGIWGMLVAFLGGMAGVGLYWFGGGRDRAATVFAFCIAAAITRVVIWVQSRSSES